MPQFPTDSSTATLQLQPRLKLLSNSTLATLSDSDADQLDLQMSVREQLLRAKQLLLQLKGLGLTPDTPGLQQNLSFLRLAMRSLEQGELTPSQLNDVRLVLDEVTRHFNQHSQRRRQQNAYEEHRSQLSEWFENAIAKDAWPLDPIRDLSQHLHREYLYQSPPLWWFQATPDEPYLWAASHGLNTAQVLQRMLHPVQHSSKLILNAILAGILHDLGMARLPVKVLSAEEGTTTVTRQQWRSHATWLAERLRSHLRADEFDIAQAIAQHHERMDGSGYPNKLKGEELLELGKLLAVADSYAALCQPRPHRPAYTTRQAVRLVLQEAQLGRLDEHAAIKLLPWGTAPEGSLVELSDGTQAKIVAWRSPDASLHTWRPVVAMHDTSKVLDLDHVRDRHIVQILDADTKQAS